MRTTGNRLVQRGKGQKQMNRSVQISSKADITRHIEQCRVAAEATKTKLLEIAATKDALALLYQMKFCQVGCDPLDHLRPLNLIEQLNQIFTYVASFRAAEQKKKDIQSQGMKSKTAINSHREPDRREMNLPQKPLSRATLRSNSSILVLNCNRTSTIMSLLP